MSNKLDVEDDEKRIKRLAFLLAKTDRQSSLHSSLPAVKTFNWNHPENLTSTPVSSTSQLLDRVRTFLPQLQASNDDIEKLLIEDPTSVDIENVGESESTYIEMDLGIGVYEQKRYDAPDSSSQSSDSASDDSEEDDGGNSSEEEGSGEDKESEDESGKLFTEVMRPKKPLPRRSKPLIMELDDDTPLLAN